MPSKDKKVESSKAGETTRAGTADESKALGKSSVRGRDCGEVRQSVKASVKRSAKKNAAVWEKLSRY